MGRGSGSREVKLTGVMTVKRRGKTYRYLRRRGKKLIPLPGDVPMDHPDFLEAYSKAVRQLPPRGDTAPSGTISALIAVAAASERFKAFGASYRAIMHRHFDAIHERYGHLNARGLRDKFIREDIEQASAKPARHKAWRFLCTVGHEKEILPTDPSRGIKKPVETTEGHPPWEQDEIDAFRERWPIGTARRAAFELIYWTGCRISDAVLIGPGMIGRDGILGYRQKKTGDDAYVPWTCPLPAYAEHMDAERQEVLAALRHLEGHMTFLATAHGRPRSVNGLGNMIREAAREAKVEKSAHGLRKSRAIALAEAGGSSHQIGSWTGHQTLAEIEHYIRKANRRRAVMGTNPDPQCANHVQNTRRNG